jgi:hypothetical protein
MSPGKKLVRSVPLGGTITLEVEIHRRPAGYKERIYSQIPGSLAGEPGPGAVCHLTPWDTPVAVKGKI